MRRIFLFGVCYIIALLAIPIGWNVPLAIGLQQPVGWQNWMALAAVPVAVFIDRFGAAFHKAWARPIRNLTETTDGEA